MRPRTRIPKVSLDSLGTFFLSTIGSYPFGYLPGNYSIGPHYCRQRIECSTTLILAIQGVIQNVFITDILKRRDPLFQAYVFLLFFIFR